MPKSVKKSGEVRSANNWLRYLGYQSILQTHWKQKQVGDWIGVSRFRKPPVVPEANHDQQGNFQKHRGSVEVFFIERGHFNTEIWNESPRKEKQNVKQKRNGFSVLSETKFFRKIGKMTGNVGG